MSMKKAVVLMFVVACLGGCGKAEASSASSGGREPSVEGEALAKLQSVTNDYVRKVVEEAKGVRVIYTEGMFDDDIRNEAKRRGIELETISMIDGRGPYSLREAVKNDEVVALQSGFEIWRRAGKELPLCSGVLARTDKMPEEDRQRGIEAARRLGERILELYKENLIDTMPDGGLKNKLLMIQWRIARIARMRAEREERMGHLKLALKDVELSERLDSRNAGLKRILQDMEKARERTLKNLTPRDALQLALARQDFTLARRYAELILSDDPNDPDANFAMGMNYYTKGKWTRAEECLRRCLIKRPRQPVYWNNLAMICLYTERYDEGLKLAQRALEIIPDSAEVKDTIKQLKDAREKAVAQKR